VVYTDGIYVPLEFSSANTNIATVDNTGLVTLLRKGSAIITISILDGTNRRTSVALNVQ
jgi:uncharacterized protein YjdB